MHEHLSRELFRAIHQGWRNPGDLAAVAMAHLFELCSHCRTEFEIWRSELNEGVARDEVDYDGVHQKIRDRATANDTSPNGGRPRVEAGSREARSRAEELLALPAEERLQWIRTERSPHSGAPLAEALIEESRLRTPADPHTGVSLANLARLVLHHSPITSSTMVLFLRILAHLANAVRVLGDYPRADQLLSDVRHLLRWQGTGDRKVRAEIDSLTATLRIDQFRYDEAISLLLRAHMTQRLEKCDHEEAVLLIKLSRAHLGKNENQRSLRLLEQSESLLDEGQEPRLFTIIRHIRASGLCRIGDLESARCEAESAFCTDYEDPLLTLRRQWLVTEIDQHAGDLDAAERGLLGMRAGFGDLGLEQEVAQANLDLARIYFRQGRMDKTLEMAALVEPVFVRLDVAVGVAQVREIRRAAGTA